MQPFEMVIRWDCSVYGQSGTVLPPKVQGYAWAVMQAAFERSERGIQTDLAGALEEVGEHLRRRSSSDIVGLCVQWPV